MCIRDRYCDNGVKLFGPDGYKMSDVAEKEIEALMDGDLSRLYAGEDKLGRVVRLDDVAGRYIERVKAVLAVGMLLSGMRIGLDMANGSCYKIAGQIFQELGAEIYAIGNTPNGKNINDKCGATSPEALVQLVKDNELDIGFAFDGDGDRLIVVDEKGTVIDGDQVIAVIGTYLKDNGLLKGDVVATVMSNLGLEEYFKQRDIGFIRTQVGDRYVVEAMREKGSNLGGEQSGHIVYADYGTTGDGINASLCVLSALLQSGKKASQLLNCFEKYPQVLYNLRVKDFIILDNPTIIEVIRNMEEKLANTGRVLIRKSGTEPVIRIMVEDKDAETVSNAIDSLVATFKKLI